MIDVLEAIKTRRSIRKYTNEEIPKDKIMSVLHAANWAPSMGNIQPWEFIIAGQDYAKAISSVFYGKAKDHIPNAPYIPAEEKPIMLEYAKSFGGAPTQIVVTYEVFDDAIKTEGALMSACAAVQNLCLAAAAEGLGTVWIGGHTIHSAELRRILNLSANRKVAAIIPIGFPAMEPPAPPRKDPNLVKKVQWLGC